MRFFLLLLFFTVFCATAFAQGRVRGKVLEDKTYIAVGGVRVENINNRAYIATDAAGNFSIVAKPGDVLTFSSLGYKADTVLLTSLDVLTVYLTPEQNMLNEVKVKEIEFPPGAFAFKPMMGPLGSKKIRYQTDRMGNPIGGIKFNPLSLFGGGDAPETKAERFAKEEQIAQVFNAKTLGKYLPISGQELTNFLTLYTPDVKTFYSKDFDITEYLNASYRKFMQMPIEKRQSKTEFALK